MGRCAAAVRFYTATDGTSVSVGAAAPDFTAVPDDYGHGTKVASIVAAIGGNALSTDGANATDTVGVLMGGVRARASGQPAAAVGGGAAAGLTGCVAVTPFWRLQQRRQALVAGHWGLTASPPAAAAPLPPPQAALYSCRFIEADGFGRMSDALRCLNWVLTNQVAISVNAYGVDIKNKQ